MATYATFEDVEARFHLPIEDELQSLVEERLEDAEDIIRGRIPDLDDQIISGDIRQRTVVRITADAVIRLLNNPDGFSSETDGNYTYMRDQDSTDGRLTILPEDWIDLGVRSGIYVIQPGPKLPWEVE